MSRRCGWVNDNPRMIEYHDREWGVPVHEDRRLFEYLVLDAFQAGLSWEIVLNKRENFRKAFDEFDPDAVARYDRGKIEGLLEDTGIIRNRLKIESTIGNARAFLAVQEEFGSFDDYIWRFVGGEPRMNAWKRIEEIPARTERSDAMSVDLKSRGFKFVGSTICYAFMQAAGLVNDHTIDCFRHDQV